MRFNPSYTLPQKKLIIFLVIGTTVLILKSLLFFCWLEHLIAARSEPSRLVVSKANACWYSHQPYRVWNISKYNKIPMTLHRDIYILYNVISFKFLLQNHLLFWTNYFLLNKFRKTSFAILLFPIYCPYVYSKFIFKLGETWMISHYIKYISRWRVMGILLYLLIFHTRYGWCEYQQAFALLTTNREGSERAAIRCSSQQK